MTWSNRGVRALVILHERSMRNFVAAWRDVRTSDLALRDGSSPDAVFAHVLRCARWYLSWLSKTAGRDDHALADSPLVGAVGAQGERYADELLAAFESHLTSITDSECALEAKVSWGATYSIDSLLEHAVMHPERHRFQLEEALANVTSR